MAALPNPPITVEEFRRLPQAPDNVYYELHRGEVVVVTRPKLKHHRLQRRLRQLLQDKAGDGWVAETEVAFRALVEHDMRVADVALVAAERWNGDDGEDNLRGGPELVVEVLSESNSAREMYEREQLCLENGSREFWVVDPDRRTVRVTTSEGRTTVYRTNQEIRIAFLNDVRLSVDEIFG